MEIATALRASQQGRLLRAYGPRNDGRGFASRNDNTFL